MDSLSSEPFNDNLLIKFIEYEGCPILEFELKDCSLQKKLGGLLRVLADNGVEIFTNNITKKPCVYLKMYTDEEMKTMLGDEYSTDFSSGFSIKTFFESFPTLIKFLDLESYLEYKFFLDESDTLAIDNLLAKA